MSKDDTALLQTLAQTLARQPRSTLQQLAARGGISKATLYRMSNTREALIEQINAHATTALDQAFDSAGLESLPPLQALRNLTQALLDMRQFFAFLLSQDLMERLESGQDVQDSEACLHYMNIMRVFFERGQREGVFRSDLPASWLATSYDFLLFGMMESVDRNEVDPQQMVALVERMFLEGARPPQPESDMGEDPNQACKP